MSTHKTHGEISGLKEALKLHGLPTDTPSQNADCFRNGYVYAMKRSAQELEQLRKVLTDIQQEMADYIHLANHAGISNVETQPKQSSRQAREAMQRARMEARYAARTGGSATADFDLPAPNDAVGEPAVPESSGTTPPAQFASEDHWKDNTNSTVTLAAPQVEPVYLITNTFTDPDGTWRIASRDAYDIHPAKWRRVLYTAPAPAVPSDAEAQRLVDTLRNDASGGQAATVHDLDAAANWIEAALTAAPAPVPSGWRDEVQRIAEMAHTAMIQDRKDQSNILEVIADRLCGMLATAEASLDLQKPSPSISEERVFEIAEANGLGVMMRSIGSVDTGPVFATQNGYRTEALIDTIKQVLSDVQWSDDRFTEEGTWVDLCPWCGNSKEQGHLPSCKLHSVVKDVNGASLSDVVEDAKRYRFVMDWNNADFAVFMRVGNEWLSCKNNGPIDAAREKTKGT